MKPGLSFVKSVLMFSYLVEKQQKREELKRKAEEEKVKKKEEKHKVYSSVWVFKCFLKGD